MVLIGDPNSPIGGFLVRFDFPDGVGPGFTPIPQHLPFLNVPLSIGAAPTSPFPTDIYTGEYDGAANSPQDLTNLLAVVNAAAGAAFVHPFYPTFDNVSDAFSIGSIGDTNFFMIPEQLPILMPIYQLGDVGKVVGDTLAPGLGLIIDWGYGNPGDPAVGVDGTDAIGPWAVNASGQLVPSGVIGFIERMDPLQMLAGVEYAAVQTVVGPINDLLADFGQPTLSGSITDTLLSLVGYSATNEADQLMLTGLDELAQLPGLAGLAPDALFSGTTLISGEPLLALVGLGFDVFNIFGA